MFSFFQCVPTHTSVDFLQNEEKVYYSLRLDETRKIYFPNKSKFIPVCSGQINKIKIQRNFVEKLLSCCLLFLLLTSSTVEGRKRVIVMMVILSPYRPTCEKGKYFKRAFHFIKSRFHHQSIKDVSSHQYSLCLCHVVCIYY